MFFESKSIEDIVLRFVFLAKRQLKVQGLGRCSFYSFDVHFQVITSLGTSPFSTSFTFKTKLCSPPANIKTSESDITSTSVKIQWETPLHIGKNVNIVDYQVELMKGRYYGFVVLISVMNKPMTIVITINFKLMFYIYF